MSPRLSLKDIILQIAKNEENTPPKKWIFDRYVDYHECSSLTNQRDMMQLFYAKN